MSGITEVSLNPVANCFNGIQHHLYSAHEKICGLCSTDSKVYAFLILGRVLQAAALVSLAASAVFTFLVGPVALVGLVPAIAMGLLGTYVAGNPQELNEIVQMARPFVPGQPIGLVNGGSNCWLNSSLQMLAHVPAFERRMRQIPQLVQFLDSYRAARTNYYKVSPDIDTHQIRQVLHRETGGVIDQGHVQEDAAQVFEWLFQGPNGLYQFEHLLNGAPANPRREPMIQVDIERGVPIPTFENLLSGFFDHRTDIGQRQQLFFPRAPDDLLIQFKRFYRDRDGTQGKVSENIETPERFQLPSRFVRSGENAAYQCDAFLLHYGASQDGGHYVSYIKVGTTWWYCSDSRVYEVSDKHAQTAMKQSYIMHYAKVS